LVKKGIHAFRFLTAALVPPKKVNVLESLGIVTGKNVSVGSKATLTRVAEVDVRNHPEI
jgi:hypothetical protein